MQNRTRWTLGIAALAVAAVVRQIVGDQVVEGEVALLDQHVHDCAGDELSRRIHAEWGVGGGQDLFGIGVVGRGGGAEGGGGALGPASGAPAGGSGTASGYRYKSAHRPWTNPCTDV